MTDDGHSHDHGHDEEQSHDNDSGDSHDHHGGDNHDRDSGDSHDHHGGDNHEHTDSQEHERGDHHDEPQHEHDHHHHEAADVSFGVLTVSTSRTLEDDGSGDALVSLIEDDGKDVVARDLVTDDRRHIAAAVLAMVEEGVDAIVVTGGTGLAPSDVTVEAVRPLCGREIPGFGDLFRMLSYEDIGPHAMLSRAFAGVVDDVPVFCLPGSEQGATFGTEQLVLPTVSHVVDLVQD